jgi:hypothetical protein
MTLPRFGKVVPIQCDVLRLIGYRLTRGHVGLDIPDEERLANMREGLAALHQKTGQDFGYDVAAWHKYLLSRSDLGYDHPYGFAGVRRAVREAARDPERARLIRLLADAESCDAPAPAT